MKKVLASFLAVGLMAAAANAEVIGLRWAAPTVGSTQVGPGTVEIFLEMQGDASFHGAVSGLIFQFAGANAATAPDANLVVGNYTTSVSGWSTGGITGAMTGAQFAVGGNTDLVGPGNFVLGTFDVDWIGPADGTTKPFVALIPQNPAGLLDGDGAKYVWNTNTNVGASGYVSVAFDGNFGNPGWGTMPLAGHEPTANPLFITKFPEPSSLALIALGGFALLRRRS
jgi:hypothetical protein